MPGRQRVDRIEIGASAEQAAFELLTGHGLACLARNVRYPFGELDLVMRDSAVLVFVEVRFRRGKGFGGAAVSVDAAKRRKIARAAQAWLSSHRHYADASCRFDVVAASPQGAGLACDWIRSAFTLDDLW